MSLSKREREQQERENQIIETAIKLFCKYGYESISMDMIAKESEFTKRTLYRYFSSKEDLFFATALRSHQHLYEMLSDAMKQGKTGFDKVKLSYAAYYSFISKYPELARLVNLHKYTKGENIEQTSSNYKKFAEVDNLLFASLRKIFLVGQEDGSIRNDLDINELAFSIIYIAVGFFQLASITGDTYPEHCGYEKDSFFQFSIERLLESIKA